MAQRALPRVNGTFRLLRPSSGRTLAVTGLASALVLSLTGCLGDSRPSPEDAATALAEAIAARDYSAVPLTDGAAEVPGQLEAALADLADVTAWSSVVSTAVDGDDRDRATATLSVRWRFGEGTEDSAADVASPAASPSAVPGGDRDWAYETEAELAWDEDAQAWLVDLRPDDVVAGLEPGGTVEIGQRPAERGAILDGAGEELMMERPVAVVGLDKARLGAAADAPDVATAATAVAEAAGVTIESFVTRAEAAGDEAFVAAITLRADGSTDIPEAEIAQVPGGRIIEDTAVLAPTRAFARDVLGTVGEPTAEQVEASDGQLQAGVEAGLSGLQADWQDHLAGRPGLEVRIENPDTDDDGPSADPSGAPDASSSADPAGGGPAGPAFTADPVPGRDLASTLDRAVQAEAEAVVAASEVPAGLVALRPSDGHVLAAASSPEGWPVAASGSFAPGSTFKVVTALALLRDGLAPEDTVQCPDTVTVHGMVVGNYDGYPDASVGAIPFSEAFAESCNTVFVGAHDTITAAQETEAAEALGLTGEPVTGLSSAVLGSVPDDSTGTEHAANLFGQGVVEASPLGMATVAASVAAGHTVRPVFVSDPAVEVPAAPSTGITAAEGEQLRSLMAGVVETGTAEMLQDVPGAPVIAKTGTAQFVADGEDLAHTWLIAVHGDLAVALFFNEGLGGGHDNGPVVRDFLTDVEAVLPSTEAGEAGETEEAGEAEASTGG